MAAARVLTAAPSSLPVRLPRARAPARRTLVQPQRACEPLRSAAGAVSTDAGVIRRTGTGRGARTPHSCARSQRSLAVPLFLFLLRSARSHKSERVGGSARQLVLTGFYAGAFGEYRQQRFPDVDR